MRIVAAIALFVAGLGSAFGQLSAPNTLPAFANDSPAVAAALVSMDDYLRSERTLSPRTAALLPLVTAREMSLPYEWALREDAALAAGVDAKVIDVVRRNRPVAELAGDEALVVDFGRQLFRERHVKSETFAALVARFGRRGAFDAMMWLAYPAMTGVLQRAADQPPPPGWKPERLPAIEGVGTPAGRIGEFVALGERPSLATDVYEDSYYRFPLLKREEVDADGRAIFDRMIGADKATTPRGPLGMTFLSPGLAEPVQDLNAALRETGALDTRMVEITIAATGREMNSQYQWNVHGSAAERANAGAKVMEALRTDGDLAGLEARDAAAIALVRDIFRESAVRPATLARAVELFGKRGAVEIAALAGDYLMMTTVYNALGMRLNPQQTASLPHRVGAPVGAEWR